MFLYGFNCIALLKVLFILVRSLNGSIAQDEGHGRTYGCQSIDAVIGQPAIIGCTLPPSRHVYWFDETDDAEPLIRLEDGARYGRGYDSGEYNITTNGSLAINRVSTAHNFSILVITGTKDDNNHKFHAQLTVTGFPTTGCQSIDGVIGQPAIIECTFPPGDVYWFDETNDVEPLIRFEGGDRSGRGFQSGDYNITNNGSLVVNRVSTAHNFSILVITRDGSENNFIAQLTVTGMPTTDNKQNALVASPTCVVTIVAIGAITLAVILRRQREEER